MPGARQSAPVLPSYEQRLRAFFAARGVDLDAQAIGFLLFRTETDVIAEIEACALRPLGLTHAGFVLLMTLWIYGPSEPRLLARVQRVSRPTIVSTVNTLERAGLVRRIPSSVDRRLVTVELTPAGSRTVARAQKRVHDVESRIAGALSRNEQRTLAQLLRKLGAGLRQQQDCEDTA